MKQLLTVLLGFFFIAVLSSQPSIEWQKKMGGTGDDHVFFLAQTLDGGYIALGNTTSNDEEVTGLHNSQDIWVVKLSAAGDIQWQSAFGSYETDYGGNIEQTRDGGYIFTGRTNSSSGDVSNLIGQQDIWVVKLDALGNIQWDKSFGSPASDQGPFIHETTDQGYFLTLSTPAHNYDYELYKLDASGNVLWHHNYGGSKFEMIGSMALTNDGGCVIAGSSWSFDGDITGHHGIGDFGDYWIVKVDSLGILEWERSLGGTKLEQSSSIIQTTNGEYLISGFSVSNDGDVTGHHLPNSEQDAWVVKLDYNGQLLWQRSLGGSKFEEINGINQTDDGGFILAGTTSSIDGDIAGGAHGSADVWLLKLSESGAIEWQKLLGGSSFDSAAKSILQTNDGGYIFPGYANSQDGDVLPGIYGMNLDFWLVKLSPASIPTTEPAAQTAAMDIFPNPTQQSITISIPAGETLLQIHITDLFGREVVSRSIQNGGSVDVSVLPNGLYTATATSPESKVYSSKFRKQE